MLTRYLFAVANLFGYQCEPYFIAGYAIMLRKMKCNGHLFCSCDMFLHYCYFSPFYLFF